MPHDTAIILMGPVLQCCNCFAPFQMTQEMYQARKNDHGSFYCPVGHAQVFLQKSEAERAWEARDAARIAQSEAERARGQAEHELARLRRRQARGICSFCNRSFHNVAQHMKSKHSEHVK